MCEGGREGMCAGVNFAAGARGVWDPPGAGVISDLEKLDMDSGNQTQVIWKSNTSSSPGSKLSSPLFEHF